MLGFSNSEVVEYRKVLWSHITFLYVSVLKTDIVLNDAMIVFTKLMVTFKNCPSTAELQCLEP